MPTPLDPRKKATSIKIHISNGAGVDITWADGHASHYDFAYLREECPCATCSDAREKKISMGVQPAAPLTSAVLPMFKPKVRAQTATQIGSYAIQLGFNDGHSTGIYSYDYFRIICPCADCAQAFRAAAS